MRHVTKLSHADRNKRKLACMEDLKAGMTIAEAMKKYELGRSSIQKFARTIKDEKMKKLFPREYPQDKGLYAVWPRAIRCLASEN